MPTATISSKGRITITADVRRALLVEKGDRVEFVEVEPGRYELVAASRSGTASKGMFGESTRTVSIEEMNRAIATQGPSGR